MLCVYYLACVWWARLDRAAGDRCHPSDSGAIL